MKNVVIKAEGLGKQYRLGEKNMPYKTLYDGISSLFVKERVEEKKKKEEEKFLWALRDCSFEIEKGDIVAIVGRNGAGKTTLLKLLSRITEPTEGSATIKGRVGSLLEVGTGFHPELTGRENIFLNGAILGMKAKEIEKNFDNIVEFADLHKFMDTPVKRYSSGMYVRLAFSVAAHLEPEILLVDEVLAVGDIEFQKKCIGRMGKVAESGRTVVVVSHNMGMVKTLCSKGILLEHGQIMKIGNIDEVIDEYALKVKADPAEKVIASEAHDRVWMHKILVKKVTLEKAVEDRFRVYWQQPIALSIEIDVEESVEEMSFGVSINRMDGTCVLAAYSDDHHRPKISLPKGSCKIHFEIENQLRPDNYIVHLWAHEEHAHVKKILNLEAATLEVLGWKADDTVFPPDHPSLITGVGSSFKYSE